MLDAKKSYAFVVDGDTERWYVHMLQHHESHISIQLKPELAQKKSVLAQYEQVISLAKAFSHVFWIVDMDKYIKERRDNVNNQDINMLQQYRKKLPSNVEFIANTPCFEFWVLLHCHRTSRYFGCCDDIEREIRKYADFSNYQKTEKYFKQYNNDIYKRMRPMLPVAIKNAKYVSRIDFGNLEQAVCQMHKIFAVLKIQF